MSVDLIPDAGRRLRRHLEVPDWHLKRQKAENSVRAGERESEKLPLPISRSHGAGTSTTFPMVVPASIISCARAASASGEH